jgi:hypothetical protein
MFTRLQYAVSDRFTKTIFEHLLLRRYAGAGSVEKVTITVLNINCSPNS